MKMIVLVALLALGACAVQSSGPARIVTLTPQIPGSLLNCAADPAVTAPASQAVVANYVVSLWQAGHDCRAHLAAIRSVLQQHTE